MFENKMLGKIYEPKKVEVTHLRRYHLEDRRDGKTHMNLRLIREPG